MLEQEAKRPEAGKGPALGHQEAEGLASRLGRRVLNHVGYRASGMAVLGVLEEPGADLGSAQQFEWIETHKIGHFDEADETCCSDLAHFAHLAQLPSRSVQKGCKLLSGLGPARRR